MSWWRSTFALAILGLPAPALAHGSQSLFHDWSFEPWAVVPLLLALLAYLLGLTQLWRRADGARPGLRRNAGLFLLGWLVLAGAATSPLHEAGGRSFTMHMIEHELIMLLAAPLLALPRPLGVMIWALPAAGRQAAAGLSRSRPLSWLWRQASAPVHATLIQAAVIWAWHAPGLFDLALRHDAIHILQHLCFLVSALLFWWAMVHGRDGGPGLSALCLFLTSMVGGALGALMTFSASPWYGDYAAMGMNPYGLTPIEDQQLAGLLMWIPGGTVHAAVALAMVMRWLAQPTAAVRGAND